MKSVVAGSADVKPRMELIAPLDPLMWDKALVQAIWDYQYSWEIYTPAEKRKYGYYTLPLLYGDRFVGRVWAVPDRKDDVLRVQGLWWEPDVRVTKKLRNALARTLRTFARFNGVEGVAETKLSG